MAKEVKKKKRLTGDDAAVAIINDNISASDYSQLSLSEKKHIARQIKASKKYAREHKDKKTMKALSAERVSKFVSANIN